MNFGRGTFAGLLGGFGFPANVTEILPAGEEGRKVVDRSEFNATSAAADRRLEECKAKVSRQSFDGEHEGTVMTLDPGLHLVDNNWKKFGDFLKELNLVAVRVKATPAQIKALGVKRKAAYFVGVARSQVSNKISLLPTQVLSSALSDSLSVVLSVSNPQADARQGAATHAATVSSKAATVNSKAASPSPPKGAKAAKGAASSSSSSSSSSSKAAKAAPVAGTGKVSKKVDKSDKDRIKRAPSPYIIFCTETRNELKEKNPEATFGELGKLLGQLWGTMDETARAPFAKQADMLKVEMTKAKDAAKVERGPKRPPSPYIIFCTETRNELKEKNPEASFGELGRLLGQIWGTMDETAKKPYVDKSEVLKAASLAAVASAAAQKEEK